MCASNLRRAREGGGERGQASNRPWQPLCAARVGKIGALTGLHLLVEDDRLGRALGHGLADEVLLEEGEDVLADLVELLLDLALVVGDQLGVGRALLLLLGLNRADDAERGTAGADDVLVGDGEQVALLERQVGRRLLGDLLHVLDHLIVALRLWGKRRLRESAPLIVRRERNDGGPAAGGKGGGNGGCHARCQPHLLGELRHVHVLFGGHVFGVGAFRLALEQLCRGALAAKGGDVVLSCL